MDIKKQIKQVFPVIEFVLLQFPAVNSFKLFTEIQLFCLHKDFDIEHFKLPQKFSSDLDLGRLKLVSEAEFQRFDDCFKKFPKFKVKKLVHQRINVVRSKF